MIPNGMNDVMFPQWINTHPLVETIIEERETSPNKPGQNRDVTNNYYSYLKKQNMIEDNKPTDYFF
jgi:hypothetical protein